MIYDGITLTDEQDHAINCMLTNEDTIIQAPAGSGKTFILKAGSKLQQGNSKRGSYIAFNKAIAEEGKATFPSNVDCRTGHSMAFGKEGYKYKHRFGKLTGAILSKTESIGKSDMFSSRANKGYMILDTIRRFCYSDDPEITQAHTPYVGDKIKDQDIIDHYNIELPIQAKKIWEKMVDVNESMPVTHDMYLKVWALNNPFIPKDFILFDEAQDANPVILGVVRAQTHMQKIFVGDRYQQIYSWRGAQDAMTRVTAVNSAFLSQSFRFGHAIAEVANKILQNYTPDGENPIIIKGNPNQNSVVGPIPGCPNAMICRTNSGVISNVFTYIAAGHRVYIQGGPNQLISLLRGAKDLRAGKTTIVPDLALFTSWEDFIEYTKTEDGQNMCAFVDLIEDFGIEELLSLLRRTEGTARNADITLTTAHKAKGLEWDTVKLNDDFLFPTSEHAISSGEVNVLYVAATRALKTLDISTCRAANVDAVLKMIEMEKR